MSTLYITKQGTTVSVDGERLVVKKQREILFETPSLKISKLVLVGMIQLTSGAINFLTSKGKEVYFLNAAGRLKGILSPIENSSVEGRIAQFGKCANDKFRMEVSKSIVIGKLKNSRRVVLNSAEKRKKRIAEIKIFDNLIAKVDSTKSLDELRGLEGYGAREYFKILSALVPEEFTFKSRSKRPPLDPFNVLLSMGYTLLTTSIITAIKLNSLDPYAGFLHSDKRGAPAFALDLMEEWRPVIDSWLLELVEKRLMPIEDFHIAPARVTFLKDGMKKFFAFYEEKLIHDIYNVNIGETTSFLRSMEMQAYLMKCCFMGKREKYTPFRLR
jgi:CRISP-associated protein Cas1